MELEITRHKNWWSYHVKQEVSFYTSVLHKPECLVDFLHLFVMFCVELLMLKFHIMEVCICQIAPSVWGENYKQEKEREVLNYMLSQTPIMPSQKDDSSKQCS